MSDALAGYRERRGLVEQERIGDGLVQERVVGMRMSISCFWISDLGFLIRIPDFGISIPG